MELQYEKALKEHNLSMSELPEDAVVGIENIKEVLKGINILQSRGVKPKEKTLKKLKAMDKWVYYEILDYLHETDKNEEEIPYESDEVLDELEKDGGVKNNQIDSTALKIEKELEELFKNGITNISSEELKNKAKLTYVSMFDNYEEGEENGVQTSKYSLIETDKLNFKLTKI